MEEPGERCGSQETGEGVLGRPGEMVVGLCPYEGPRVGWALVPGSRLARVLALLSVCRAAPGTRGPPAQACCAAV